MVRAARKATLELAKSHAFQKAESKSAGPIIKTAGI
jgi:hypothetical protein